MENIKPLFLNLCTVASVELWHTVIGEKVPRSVYLFQKTPPELSTWETILAGGQLTVIQPKLKVQPSIKTGSVKLRSIAHQIKL